LEHTKNIKYYVFNLKQKSAGGLHRTAQPPTLAAFRPWEGSAGAGRVRPAGRKGKEAKIKMRDKKFRVVYHFEFCHGYTEKYK
jgi:hypothetical protein